MHCDLYLLQLSLAVTVSMMEGAIRARIGQSEPTSEVNRSREGTRAAKVKVTNIKIILITRSITSGVRRRGLKEERM